MDALFIKILNMSITASWLIIAVLIVRFLMRKAPKWISCGMWALVLIRLICPVSLKSGLSLIPAREVIPQDIAMSEAPAINSGVPAINSTLNPIISESLAADPAAGVNPLQILTSVAASVWIAGVVVMLVYALISYLKLKKLVSASMPLRDNIMVCDDIKSPFILGIIRPIIYIPSALAVNSLDYVLSHEEAHLKRKDHLWKPLGYLLLAIYWFNPLCWAAYAMLSRDIEMACDERVIRDLDREKTAEYSQALLDASWPVRGIRACPLAFGEVSVKQRVKGVLNYKKPAFWVIIAALIICGAVAVTLMTDPAANAGEPTDKVSEGYKVVYIDNDVWGSEGFVDKSLNRDMMTISSIESCPVFRIDTKDDLDKFRSMIVQTTDTSKGNGDLLSFDEAVGDYDDKYFEENSLLLAYVHTSNDNFDVALKQMDIEENCIYMFMERTGEDNQISNDHQYGFIIKEIADSELADIKYYQAQYGNNNVWDYTGTADETSYEGSSEAGSTDSNGSVLATGTFIKPVDAVITKGFGQSFGKMHEGVDFAAEEGTPIAASDGGTVVTAGWLEGYGNTVEIDHGEGVMTQYAHCSELLVSEGDIVSQGQTIAKVGSTGLSTGPHCHFEIIVNGEAVDPMPWLDASENAIPIIISNEEDPLGALIEVSRDPEAQKSFEYIYPEVPEDYHIDEKSEDETSLMVGYLGSQDKAFLYWQTLAKGGHAQLNVPDGCEARREIINGRNAVIMDKGDGIYFIMIEDGTNVFQFEGSCGYDMLYDMAVQVTSAE